MKVIDYKFRPGSHLPRKDAKAIGKHLAQLHNEAGSLTAQHVVDDARSRKSPLHQLFEWDNDKAAEAHRRHQAQRLIRDVVIVYETRSGDKHEAMNAYVKLRSTEDDDATPYLATPQVLSDSDLRERLLRQALTDADDWRRRYRELEELSQVFDALDKVKTQPRKAAKKPLRRPVASRGRARSGQAALVAV